MRTTTAAMIAVMLALPAAAQHGAPAAAPPKAAPAHPDRPYTLETPIHVLMEDPVTLAWLDRHFPGMSARMRDLEVGTMFDGVSIQGLSIDPDHGRALTPEVMAKLAASLAAAQSGPAPKS